MNIADVVSDLRARRDAIDECIKSFEKAEALGVFVAASQAWKALGKTDAAAREAGDTPRRAKRATREVEAPAAASEGEVLLGKYDERILACIRTCDSAFGISAKEIVFGVVGKSKAQALYGTVYSAIRRLEGEGRIRKDGRFYFPGQVKAA